jgi:CRISPR-associated exonuclease Cas4
VQYIENKYARVSEVATYYLCPRLAYYGRRRATALTDAEVRAGVLKSISLGLGPVVSSPTPGKALDEAIRAACSDTFTVYGPEFSHAISEAGQEARTRAKEILAGLLREKERAGEEMLTSILSPAVISKTVYSDRLRMSGTVDKIYLRDSVPVPIVVSASLPPQDGIYASDRIRLAAYAKLLSVKQDTDCQYGAVEYVMGWSLRRADVRFEDKRKVLYARNRVLAFQDGAMPDGIKGKWCGHCKHYEACNIKASLLDSLFKKRP